MPDYKRMYFELAAKVADAVELLTAAQLAGEQAYAEQTPAGIGFTVSGGGPAPDKPCE